jgi:hypothetical protein
MSDDIARQAPRWIEILELSVLALVAIATVYVLATLVALPHA